MLSKGRKKVTWVILALCISFFTLGVSSVSAADILIMVNDEEVYMDVQPIIIQDRTLVPLRALAEMISCRVDWFEEDQRIVVYAPSGGDPLMVLMVGDPDVTVNTYNGATGDFGGYVERLDVPPLIVDGRTMVPLRFVVETLGFDVFYSEGAGGVKVIGLYRY